jgi:hypothetical protein
MNVEDQLLNLKNGLSTSPSKEELADKKEDIATKEISETISVEETTPVHEPEVANAKHDIEEKHTNNDEQEKEIKDTLNYLTTSIE